MLIRIEEKVLEKYPEAEIGYLVAQGSVRKSDPFVENLKESLSEKMIERGINATNFVTHPNISIWRKIYEEDFQVKAKTYRSSVEALLRRVVTGKKIWSINNIVDLCNCCSLFTLFPMGVYDLKKVSGNIRISFGQEGETFLGIGEREKVDVKDQHVIYADESRVLCWLWNHKDAAATCIDDETKEVVFFIDSAQPSESNTLQEALDQLSHYLESIQCTPVASGILNRESPQGQLR